MIVKVRQPKIIPYFWAGGMSRRPNAARMSLRLCMEVMWEKALRSLSRSDSSGVDDMVDADISIAQQQSLFHWFCDVSN